MSKNRAGTVSEVDLADPEDDDLDDDLDDPEDGEESYADSAPLRPVPPEARVFESTFTPGKPKPFAIKAYLVDEETGEVSYDGDGEAEFEMHSFTARGNPGAGGMLAMGSLIRVSPDGRQIADVAGIMAFFERVLVPRDWPRLRELVIDRTDQQVQMEDLGAVYSWLVEEYGARPTRPSSPSSNGASRRGRSSTARRR